MCGLAQQNYHRAMYQYGETAPCYSSVKMLEEALNEDLRCEKMKDWSYGIDNVDGSAVIRHHGIELSQDDTPTWDPYHIYEIVQNCRVRGKFLENSPIFEDTILLYKHNIRQTKCLHFEGSAILIKYFAYKMYPPF